MSVSIVVTPENRGTCKRISVCDSEHELGHAYVYTIYNSLHDEPYGLLEDVFVDEKYRRQGIGRQLVSAAIAEAKALHCYKLIGTSRASRVEVHDWYEKLGFEKYGFEFRINLL